MADRTSVAIFSELFESCAKEGEAGRRIAQKMWPLSFCYDFDSYEMGVDESLVALGLAVLEGDAVLYRTMDLDGWEPTREG